MYVIHNFIKMHKHINADPPFTVLFTYSFLHNLACLKIFLLFNTPPNDQVIS